MQNVRFLNKLSLSGNAFGGGGVDSSDFLQLTLLTELALRGCDLRVRETETADL